MTRSQSGPHVDCMCRSTQTLSHSNCDAVTSSCYMNVAFRRMNASDPPGSDRYVRNWPDAQSASSREMPVSKRLSSDTRAMFPEVGFGTVGMHTISSDLSEPTLAAPDRHESHCDHSLPWPLQECDVAEGERRSCHGRSLPRYSEYTFACRNAPYSVRKKVP